MPRIWLQWQDAEGHARQVELRDKVFVGRVCAGIDPARAIVLDDPRVSRDHLVIASEGGSIVLRETSRNGTWVNDVRVTQGGERPLADGDVIRVGGAEITVGIEPSDEEGPEDLEETMTNWTTVLPVYQFVTHLVADVRGFTTLSENLGSDKMYSVMSAVIHAFSDIVVAHHGTIKDYAGDAVYAFWEHGLVAKPERARNACAAALAQVAAVPRIVESLSDTVPEAAELRLGWGITTGMVTVSQYGARSADLAVVGDSTNLAFRISGLANKDIAAPIVVCEHTRALLHPAFTLEPLGAHRIKGKSEPVPLYGVSP